VLSSLGKSSLTGDLPSIIETKIFNSPETENTAISVSLPETINV
jgi:hypothetical protein